MVNAVLEVIWLQILGSQLVSTFNPLCLTKEMKKRTHV